MNANHLNKYKMATVKTSDNVGQMLFVFDELIKLLYIARQALLEGNHESKHNNLVKAIEVIMILRSGVNIETGEESLIKLDNFYQTTINALHHINIHGKAPEEFDDVINAIKEVRDSVSEAQTAYHSEVLNQ